MPLSNPASLKLYKSHIFTFLSVILIIILIPACGVQEDKLYSKDEAEIRFIRICKDEYNWDVNTKFIGNTLWIYLPYKKDILRFEASRFTQINKCAVGYIDGDFIDGQFYFEYEVIPLSKSREDKGVTNSLVEEARENLHNLNNVIFRVYFNAQQQPEFYVIVMADIKNGVEVIQTIYNEDLKKGYSYVFSMEEFSRRILQDIQGSLSIINDTTGRHLNYKQMELSQFLTKQIVQRIQLESLAFNSKLCNVPEEEIAKIISYCLGSYEFGGFSRVILKNLSSGIQTVLTRWELAEIKEP